MPNQDQENEKKLPIMDLSGGIQEKTTEYLQKPNELDEAQNCRYDTIGGIKKAKGYAQQGDDLTSTTSTSTTTSTTTTSTSSSTSTSTSTSTTISTTSTSTTG